MTNPTLLSLPYVGLWRSLGKADEGWDLLRVGSSLGPCLWGFGGGGRWLVGYVLRGRVVRGWWKLIAVERVKRSKSFLFLFS